MATHTAFLGPVALQRRVLRLLLLCTVAACLFLSFWFTNHLYANDNQPDALGAISGVVKDANGQPLAGVQVALWIQQSYQSTYWYAIRSVTTEADGSYRFTLLPVGIYHVGVSDAKGRYGTIFYPTANVVQQANDILIAGNSVTGIDLTVQAAGRIVATVTLAPPYTATSTYAELRQRVETPSGPLWDYVQSFSNNGSSGVFTFTGLAANSYRLCGGSYGFQVSAYECYDNVYAIEKATDLPVTSGATISNVAIVLGDGANYAQISGRVTDVADKPIADIVVYALPIINSGFPQAASAHAWTAVTRRNNPLLAEDNYYGFLYARTNISGEYRLPTLQAGQYRLQFVDLEGDYAFEYYNNGHTLNEATVLAVTERQVISHLNAQLEPASQIAGRVTLFDPVTQSEQPASNTAVLAELKLPDGQWQAVNQVNTNPNTGQYLLRGLPAGRYRISAQATVYDQYAVYQPYGVYGGSSLADATEVPVASGGTAENINITLRGPNFAGSLSGRVTANGAPVAGIKVALYNANTVCCALPSPVIYTLTDADGRYTFNGLTYGAFVLGVTDPTGRYATTYYPNQISANIAPPLYTYDDQALYEVNVALTPAGAIHGHVQQRDGLAVAGLSIRLTRYEAPNGYPVELLLDKRTDVNGDYTVDGLHPGEYFVCFSAQSYYGYSECYGNIDSPSGSYGSTKVTVTAGKTTTGIDLIWGPDLRLYLPLVTQK